MDIFAQQYKRNPSYYQSCVMLIVLDGSKLIKTLPNTVTACRTKPRKTQQNNCDQNDNATLGGEQIN